ncbi:MAG: cation transporter MgtC/SapB [Bryobacterales bacterium]|nr:cation transporter MgtC/SapB [Bryobacterales bacterium]
MPTLTWADIAVRLALTAAAGALFGINRSEKGRPAGLRTTMMVSLAACIAMILANRLTLPAGSANLANPGDPLRIPLGVLSGMGFIGAGAILRRENLVIGVTTAATVWFVTIMGLCFGSGQLGLGAVAAALGIGVLVGLEWAESLLPRERHADLILTVASNGPSEADIRSRINTGGFQAIPRGVAYDAASHNTVLSYEIIWRTRPTDTTVPPFLRDLATDPALFAVNWREGEAA